MYRDRRKHVQQEDRKSGTWNIYTNSLINSNTSGMGIKANTFFKQLADKLLVFRKSGQRYSEAITFIRKILRFDLLRPTITALRGQKGIKSKNS